MNHTLRSRQLNPCDELYWKSRGWPQRPYNWRERIYAHDDEDTDDDESDIYSEADYSDDDYYYSDEDDFYYSDEDESEECDEDYYSDQDYDEYEEERLRSLQNNPNNVEYWRLRGYLSRPSNWRGKQ
ncbi:hypothetical protein Zmor_025787 [Zophobas morio]|uniref:Uncharacterized protein n=1 Tax=Zophobas morio TaxID=2755281 RepID=A0AA38HXP6_9CUCU|nr:hypothetical protein Zmor_025787 [Zophobas morio]